MTKSVVALWVAGTLCASTATSARADDNDASVPASSAPTSIAEPTIDTPLPTEWLPAGPMRCIRRGRLRGFCAGPRRVPQPSGEAAERAAALGLGTRAAASRLLSEPPRDEWVEAAGSAIAEGTTAPDLLWPLEGGTVWRHFGRVRRRRGRSHQHEGVDLGAEAGTRIRAVNEGIVAYSDNEVTGYGNLVLVVHPDRTVTFYAHCRAVFVMAGQHVARGQLLAEVGDTGYARGTHLHFEWHVNGSARDPLHHFVGFPAALHITPADLSEEVEPPADDLPTAPVRRRSGHRAATRRSRPAAAPAHHRRSPARPPNPRPRSRQAP